MSNNTSKYQEYTFKELLDQYDRILVPMIQRDYAQGRTDKKETDVRNNLLTDIFSDKNVHFDLVFGSKEKRIIDGKEKNCFIPVDGQQRLTTLFLLHLYGQKAGKTNTELDLSKFSYDTRRAASDFCKSITSEEWAVPNDKKVSDVIKDSSWFMNYWEKDPTVEGMLNMLDAIHDKNNGTIVYPDLSKVKFYFFDLESNGLNENLYLKMNSRGKPLTAFENLKAKIEKVLPKDVEIEDKCFPVCEASPKDSFKAKWKYFMDRNWTETFWDKTRPEKYDESITKFIVRFLSGWATYVEDKDQNQKITYELKSLNSKDSYADFIPFEPIKKVLNLEKAFPSLAYALTTAHYWTDDTIKVSDKSEYKFLAVIFTYVLFDGDKDAMRFAWNMAENYVTGYDNFVTYCERVAEICKFKCNEKAPFYRALSSQKIDGNTPEQMKEEIAKAKQIINGGDEWETKIVAAEKYPFFKGAIRFLFTDENGDVTDQSWKDFDEKWANAQRFFNNQKVAPTIAIAEYFNDEQIRDIFSRYSFKTENCKSILLQKSISKPIHQFLLGTPIPNTSVLYKDIKIILESIETNNVWLLDWPNCPDVLTNYERRISEPNNGYVFQVGNEVRNKWNNIIKAPATYGTLVGGGGGNNIFRELEVRVPPAWGDEKKVINGQVYYRGLWTDIKYSDHFFRYFGNNTICLMKEDWVSKKFKNDNDGDKPENTYYFEVANCFNETADEEPPKTKMLYFLDCLIHQAEADEQNKPCYDDCQTNK